MLGNQAPNENSLILNMSSIFCVIALLVFICFNGKKCLFSKGRTFVYIFYAEILRI